ncbi:MAG: hypothetical protein JJT96_08860 [Opitutales bacterium]|nr:hypothetical protein [Opitutales bacterium]
MDIQNVSRELPSSHPCGAWLRFFWILAFSTGGWFPAVSTVEATPTPGLEFTDDLGRVTLDADFSLAGRSFTVEAWIWLKYRWGDRAVLAQTGEDNLLHLLVRNDRLHLGFWGDDLTGNSLLPVKEWVHVAYTYDEATRSQRVYLNGQNDGSRVANASFAENNRPLHIGAFFNFHSNPFQGRILELRIWDHARDGATLDAGRFSTPPLDSPGLQALFTFEGSDGTFLPEATGNLVGNTLHGSASAVEPVAGPAYLTGVVPLKTLPTGTLAEAVEGYTFSFAPRADLTDPDGTLLLNGSGPERVWGTAWLNLLGAAVTSVVGWSGGSPEITLAFSGPARIDAVTLFLANSGGAHGVGLPTSVELITPGGTLRSVAVTPGADVGGLQAVTVDELDALSETLTVRLERGTHDIALAGMAIDGERMFVQVIDFPLASTALVGSTVVLAPTSDSGLPVTLTLESGPALLDGDALTFTGEGVVTLVASQAGDSTFVPAEPVVRVVEVARAGQEILNFAEIGDRQVGDTVILEAGSGSALPVEFTLLAGPGVIENANELRFTGPGIVLVMAAQPGNDLWSPAPPILQAFAVLGGERIFGPSEGLTAGLELGTLPGRVSLDGSLSLAGRSFTVEAWIWLHGDDADQPVLGQFGEADVLHLLVRHGRLHLGFWNDDLTGGSVLPTGEWIHVAYTFDAATLEQQVFVNGEMDGSRIASAPFPENNLPLHIGGGFSEFANPFNGRILEVRIWDHARPGPLLFAGRFETPPPGAQGLDALFTFTGSIGTSIPEVTGKLAYATLSGDAVVVEPVIGPEYLLDFAFPQQPLASGSLAPAVSGYTPATAPEAAFTDPTGNLLTNGFGPARVWGDPWLGPLNQVLPSILVWDASAPALTFHFSERVRIAGVTLYAANSGGAEDIDRPDAVEISTPGGFAQSFALAPSTAPLGTLEPIEIDNLHLYTEALTLTLSGGSPRLAIAEVTFDGETLAEPMVGSDALPLPAMRFLGIEPGDPRPAEAFFDLWMGPTEARFGFPRAADDYGVRPVVKWSTDLENWEPLPHGPSAVPGWEIALLQPLPEEGRAFFRLDFTDGPPTAVAPASISAMESDGPLAFDLRFFPGTIETPLDPGSLQLLAINDQPVANFAGPITTPDGILEIFPNGNVTYVANPGLGGGQTAEETFTYTVVDRFGRSVRNTFTLTVVGENDPPSVAPIALSHASGVEPAGTTYRYFEGDFPTEASLLAATPTATGRQPTFSLAPAADATGGFGLEMTGELFVPAPGPYTFFLMGNNASVLDVGGTRVIAHDAADRSGTVELTAGTHTVRVLYFDTTEPAAELTVDYVGPGFLREAIPADAFPRLTAIPLDPLAGASDPDEDDVLTISHIDGQPIALNTPVQLASGASVQLNGDGTITYLPAPGRNVFHQANDTDSFTYTVTDSGGLSASATAQIHLARQNTAPVANGIFNLETDDLRGNLFPNEAFTDADGDELRITHVNGVPLIGDGVVSLPSTARVSLPQARDVALSYDGRNSFMRTLSQDRASDTFTVTVVDAAGASAEATVVGDWPIGISNFLGYTDSRFTPHLGPRTAQVINTYEFPVTMVTYIEQRETGAFFGHQQHALPSKHALHLDFEVPEGIELGGQHFFDLFDLHIDTVDGDPIYYGDSYANLQIDRLYSTAEKSFFRLTGAISPHWPLMLTTTAGTAPYKSGIRLIEAPYGSSASVFRLGFLVRGPNANVNVLEPSFAANILVTGICRTPDTSRFTVTNNTSETVPLTVGSGSGGTVFTFAPGETQTLNVPYEPKVLFVVREAELGLFDSSDVACPLGLSFTATPLCSDTFLAFVKVRNNNPTESFTIRVESVDFPTIRSAPQVIGNQAAEFVQLNTQGTNLGGTEGRIVVILGDIEETVETFIFSDNDC